MNLLDSASTSCCFRCHLGFTLVGIYKGLGPVCIRTLVWSHNRGSLIEHAQADGVKIIRWGLLIPTQQCLNLRLHNCLIELGLAKLT